MDHPLVRQTIDDCLSEATDVEGLINILKDLRDGTIERVAVDTTEPSAFARGILNSELYTFLDDAPLEERRTQAVLSRRTLDVRTMGRSGRSRSGRRPARPRGSVAAAGIGRGGARCAGVARFRHG